MTFTEAAWICGMLPSIPDNPARTASPGELESDHDYRDSTAEHDADRINDELWLEEHTDAAAELER